VFIAFSSYRTVSVLEPASDFVTRRQGQTDAGRQILQAFK